MQWPAEQTSPWWQAVLSVHGGMQVAVPGQTQGICPADAEGEGPQTLVPPSAWQSLSDLHRMTVEQMPQKLQVPPGGMQASAPGQLLLERHSSAARLPPVADAPPKPLPLPPVPAVPDAPPVPTPPVPTPVPAVPDAPPVPTPPVADAPPELCRTPPSTAWPRDLELQPKGLARISIGKTSNLIALVMSF